MLSSGKQQPRPERLPPTENAAKFHIYRVHLQVVQWNTLMPYSIDPVEWGWKLNNNKYIPIGMDNVAAPESLLNIVGCKCKTTSSRPCRTQLCSCVKHGLTCVAAFDEAD